MEEIRAYKQGNVWLWKGLGLEACVGGATEVRGEAETEENSRVAEKGGRGGRDSDGRERWVDGVNVRCNDTVYTHTLTEI